MSFLAPLFLLGALAISLPVVFHLIRRTTRERTAFSSLIFLLPSPPRLTRRSRLEHLLLLLLRCAALCLLALGFARPFFKTAANPSAGSVSKRVVLLLDTSASMRRAGLWDEARERAAKLLHSTSPADQVAIFTFDRQTTPLLTFDQWNGALASERNALAERKLADTRPGWSSTYLGNALIRAAETLADTGGKQFTGLSQIIVISDLQEGSHLEPLQGYEWPRGIELSIEALKSKHANNASLQLITDSDEASPKPSPGVRVRVSNAADARTEQFKVGWTLPEGGFAASPMEIYVPPGQSRILPIPPPSAPGPLNRILLQGDQEDFDNAVFTIPPETRRLKVLYFGTDPESDSKQPLYFLQRAFQETRRQAVQVLACSEKPIATVPAKTAALYIITDPVSNDLIDVLRDEVTAGKTLLLAPKSSACAANLARLLQLESVALGEAHPSNYAMLAEIDFRHPLFAPFADPRFSDFTKIHFWKYRRLDPAMLPAARVLAQFDTGDPGLLEIPIGKGHILFLASGWQPEDSQLALSTKFVPLLYSILEQSGAPEPLPAQFEVGDTLPLVSGSEAAQPAWTIRMPDGSDTALAAGETNFSRTWVPGIYAASSAQSEKVSRFAVNLDATESRTTPLPIDEFERLGAPLAHHVATLTPELEKRVRLQNAELENRQKIWRWLLIVTLAILLIETYLAGRTARQIIAPTPTTAT